MTTCGCPEAVLSTLGAVVRVELDNLRGILRLSESFGPALADVAGLAESGVQTAVDGIPSPGSIGPLDIVDYLTCPLTPFAVALDFTKFQTLDPRVQLAELKSMFSHEIADARKKYESTLASDPQAEVINIGRKYVNEFSRIQFDATSFAKAVLVAASVRTLCPEIYETGPYAAFETLSNGFSLAGGVPSTLDSKAVGLVKKLQAGEAKFTALKSTVGL